MRSKMLANLVLVGAVLIGGTAVYAADSQSDWTTKLKVKLTLLEKLGADSLHVDVDANAGALMLKGTVAKRETRELAETIAMSVDGVKRVENGILLEASVENPNKVGVAAGEAEAEVKDAILATRLHLALIDNLGSNGFEVGIAVADGVVTLEFNHDFAAELRQEATKVAKNVDGVTKVVSVDKK